MENQEHQPDDNTPASGETPDEGTIAGDVQPPAPVLPEEGETPAKPIVDPNIPPMRCVTCFHGGPYYPEPVTQRKRIQCLRFPPTLFMVGFDKKKGPKIIASRPVMRWDDKCGEWGFPNPEFPDSGNGNGHQDSGDSPIIHEGDKPRIIVP